MNYDLELIFKIINRKLFNLQHLITITMETIEIPKQQFEEMKAELEHLRKEKKESLPSVEEQLEMGLKDMKEGKIMRLA